MITPLESRLDPLGEELSSRMIWAPADARLSSQFVAFRKSFTLPTMPLAAVLRVFADARYLLWINGELALRGPARFDPRGPEYDSLDLTHLLRTGPNQIAISVMSYDEKATVTSGEMGQGANARMMKHEPGLTLRIEVDGRILVSTDETWKWSDQTRYRNADIDWAQINDRIDARVEDGDWTQTAYDDQAWKPAAKVDGALWGPLSARRIPLLRDSPVVPVFENGKSLPIALSSGEQLAFKMARMVQAYTIIELDADEGAQLSFDYQKVEYTARAGRQTYVSSDSSAFITGAIKVKSGRATVISLELVERLYPFSRVGNFKSNDEMLNKLWALCARSNEIFSEDSYVDCADRERAEWMDNDPPAFDITRVAFAGPGHDGKLTYSDPRLLEETLRRTALSQQKEGWVKAHTTSDRFDLHAHMEDRSCDWVQGARCYYESTGRAEVIREIWPVIVNQMNYFLGNRTPRGLVLGREWVLWGNPIGYVTCEGAGLNAFIYKALTDAAYLGQIAGDTQQATSFDQSASELASAFNTVLWSEKEGTYYSGYYSEADRKADDQSKQMKLAIENNLIEPTMFPALFALDQGIVPESRVPEVKRYLFANRQQADRVMTFYYLFNQMYRADDPAYDREILQTMRTKWKQMVDWEWETSWEEFDGGSKAHIYGMFPAYHLSSYVLGVRRDKPAENMHLLIEPRLGDLTSAEGIVVTEFGPVPVSWKYASGELAFRVEIPAGTTALLRVPQLGGDAQLTLNGRQDAGRIEGRWLVTTLSAGVSEGRVCYQPETQ